VVDQFLLARLMTGRFGQTTADVGQNSPIYKECGQQEEKPCGYVSQSLVHDGTFASFPGS